MVADSKEIFLDFLTVFAAESEREGKSGGVEVKNGAAANRGGEGRGVSESRSLPDTGGAGDGHEQGWARGQRWEEAPDRHG